MCMLIYSVNVQANPNPAAHVLHPGAKSMQPLASWCSTSSRKVAPAAKQEERQWPKKPLGGSRKEHVWCQSQCIFGSGEEQKGPVYLAVVRKQAESRTGGLTESSPTFPHSPGGNRPWQLVIKRPQVTCLGSREAQRKEEVTQPSHLQSPLNVLAFSERAALQVPQWCSNAEEKGSVGMFCTFFRIWRPRPKFSWIPVTNFGSVTRILVLFPSRNVLYFLQLFFFYPIVFHYKVESTLSQDIMMP